ncbi:hypothetical protein [Naasia aerilata]|uniref:Uncharacterized protein n=1 Tax=Naasia aerilata TaxID=1162966 RepID=A0ABN6XJ88_9MICO|nr:hypothetical protein [Naasia aerilata]BDZ44163.1 hypothetical protein GCM10025866_00720 [Naasia aerilata]
MRRPLLAVALAATLVLSGCGTGDSSYPAALRSQLQTTVLDVSTAASQNDLQGALNHLNDLQNEVQDARDRGDISESKYNTVMAALTIVAAKITAKMSAAGQTPTPQPTKSTSGGSTGTKRTQAPDDTTKEPSAPQQGTSQAPPSSQAPAPSTPADDDSESDDSEETATATPTPTETSTETSTPTTDPVEPPADEQGVTQQQTAGETQ